MVEKSKSWVKENFMEIVLACMFTAFWVQYNDDQKEAAEFRNTVMNEERIDNAKMQSVARILRDDEDTKPSDQDLLVDIIKSGTRGGQARYLQAK